MRSGCTGSCPWLNRENADRSRGATLGTDPSARFTVGSNLSSTSSRPACSRRDTMSLCSRPATRPAQVPISSGSCPRQKGCGSAWRYPRCTTCSTRTGRSRDFDVVHDHTILGPFYAERFPGLRITTTIHGPFNEELSDLYGALADRVPIVCISNAQRRAAPRLPVARVIHHGIDASCFAVGDGNGDDDGEYLLFLGRMSPDKGAHRAIEVARKAGVRLLLAAKMREPWERRYFEEHVEPFLGDRRRLSR